MAGNKGPIINGIIGFFVIAAILFIYSPVDSPRDIAVTPAPDVTGRPKAAEPVDANDWLCIPGRRVGPITYHTSAEDLKRIFGERNLIHKKMIEEEGTVTAVRTLIYPGQKDAVVVGWEDDRQRNRVLFVRIAGKKGARWQTGEGIGIGTTLAELNRINGAPFTFYGFGWDYGGWLIGWGKGKLQRKQPGIRLAMADSSAAALKYLGDKEFRSDAPDLTKLGVAVAELYIGLKPE